MLSEQIRPGDTLACCWDHVCDDSEVFREVVVCVCEVTVMYTEVLVGDSDVYRQGGAGMCEVTVMYTEVLVCVYADSGVYRNVCVYDGSGVYRDVCMVAVVYTEMFVC